MFVIEFNIHLGYNFPRSDTCDIIIPVKVQIESEVEKDNRICSFSLGQQLGRQAPNPC